MLRHQAANPPETRRARRAGSAAEPTLDGRRGGAPGPGRRPQPRAAQGRRRRRAGQGPTRPRPAAARRRDGQQPQGPRARCSTSSSRSTSGSATSRTPSSTSWSGSRRPRPSWPSCRRELADGRRAGSAQLTEARDKRVAELREAAEAAGARRDARSQGMPDGPRSRSTSGSATRRAASAPPRSAPASAAGCSLELDSAELADIAQAAVRRGRPLRGVRPHPRAHRESGL